MIRRHRMRSPDRNWRSGRMVGLSSRGIDPVNSGFRQLAVYRPKVILPNGRHAGDTHRADSRIRTGKSSQLEYQHHSPTVRSVWRSTRF